MKPTRMKAFADGNFHQLVREMEGARNHLAKLPEDQKWSQDQLAGLDDVRHAALRLAQEVEATIDVFEGKEVKQVKTQE